MKKSKSIEDYLESILMISEKSNTVRSVDVARELGVTKPSVSVAMKKMREEGLITFDENDYIHFTKDGKKIAENIYAKHKLLKSVLSAIGVDDETATDEACLIEHVISDDTYKKIKKFYEGELKGN